MSPTRATNSRPSGDGRRLRLAIGLIAVAIAGCAWVPRGRVEDCRQRVQVLQATNQELRDVAVRVRQENRDLAQRSLDDTRRIRAQEEAIARYERSIADYQDEREQLHALLDQIRGEVRTAAIGPATTAMVERLETFAQEHPAFQFDPAKGQLLVSNESLFDEPGGPALSAGGRSLLDALAEALGGSGARGLSLAVTSASAGSSNPSTDQEVRRTSTSEGPPESSRLDSLERARRIRDHLADRLDLPASRIAVSGGGSTVLDTGTTAGASGPSDQVAIQIRGPLRPAIEDSRFSTSP